MKKLTLFLNHMLRLILSLLLTASQTHAFITEEASPTGQFSMQTLDAHHKKIGTVSIRKQKDRSKLEFEGTGLPRGKYVLYLSRYCQPVTHKKLRDRKSKEQLGTAVLSFRTQSGDTWTEQWLTSEDLAINNVDQAFVFILVRQDHAGPQIAGKTLCAHLNEAAPSPENTAQGLVPLSE